MSVERLVSAMVLVLTSPQSSAQINLKRVIKG